MHGYRYRGRRVPYRPDRMDLSPPRYTWPEDRESMRKEEALTQRSHHPTDDSSCPDEHDGKIWLDASQFPSILYSNQPGLEDDTDEVDSVVLEGPRNNPNEVDSYNNTKEVYTDAVEEPRNIPVGVNSENDTDDAYTDALERPRHDTGEADDDIATDTKIDHIFLPACGIIFSSAVVIKKRWLLPTAMIENFREAEEENCLSNEKEIPVDVQLQSSQRNDFTLGDESHDNNTHVRFINRLGGEGTSLMNQQNMCSSLHSDSSRKRSRTEDLEIEVQEPESKICRLG